MSPVSATTVVYFLSESSSDIAESLLGFGSFPGKGGLGRAALVGDAGAVVGGKVLEDVIDGLGRKADCDLLGGPRHVRQGGEHLSLDFQDGGGRLLAGLDAGLVVGVDVHEGRVEPHRPFKQCNQ